MGRKYAVGINVNGINIFRKVVVAVRRRPRRAGEPLLSSRNNIYATAAARTREDRRLRKENNLG